MKIKRVFLFSIILLLVVACNFSSPTATDIPQKPPEETDRQPPQWQDDTLYVGMMVHLEGWDDAGNKEQFQQHARYVREVADLFEKYDAKLTLESKEFTTGCLKWDENVLLEMQDRGHGIGVHADVGGNKDYRCNEMTSELRRLREELEQLDVIVRHVSGIVSHCDWVTAAVDAGYEFTSGTVEYALISLPQEKWPEGFQGCTNPAACHQAYPPDLEGRLHPWRARSGLNWTEPHPQGNLVILPSGGGMVCMAEETQSKDSFTMCEFNISDLDAVSQEMRNAIALTDEYRLNMYYFSWSIGSRQDMHALEEFLQRVDVHVNTGEAQWATLPEMYDLFLQWEQTRPPKN